MDQQARDLDTLARTLWGEARGEGRQGMIAVAWVILNRARKPCWWSRNKGDGIEDDTIEAVCRDPWQFSCWNVSDPNRAKLLAVDTADPAFRLALAVAEDALAGRLPPDPTSGACHYKVSSLPWPKDWGEPRDADFVHGHHAFYRGIA
ncbi:cell wall hydrolase [Ferrovibrio terrae]|uniref:cell wall hydrolase n=1 Tax=Ferrovibrio terrae TaxID=2594003 RepID=UPI003137C813